MDIAELGLRADSSDLRRANTEMGRFRKGARQTETATERMERQNQRLASSFRTIAGVAGGALAAIGGFRLGSGALREFAEFERLLIQVGKTADLEGQRLEQLGERVQQIGRSVPVTNARLLELAAAAGQLGVKGVDDIGRFAKTLGQLETATDIAGEEGARQLARLLNVTGEAISDVDRLGSSITALGNNFAATEQEIVRMSTFLGAATQQYGLAAAEVVGLSAALTSLGQRAETSGSSVGAALAEIDTAIASGGDSLQTLIDLTGQSATQLRQAFAENATGVMLDFAEALNALPTSEQTEILEEFSLAGRETRRVIGALSSDVEMVRRALASANDEWNRNEALNIEAAKAAESFSAQMTFLGNAMNEAAVDIGRELAPVILDVTRQFRDFIQEASDSGQLSGFFGDVADSAQVFSDRLGQIASTIETIGFGALAVGAGRATTAIQAKVAALYTSITATTASNRAEDAAAATALRKAQADNAAATSALNMARAEANLAMGTNAQTLALNNQLSAMQRAATARGALNTATAAYTATTQRATLATRVFSTAVGGLGGPLGIAVTGLTALYFWTQRNQEIANDMEPTVRTVRELANEAERLASMDGAYTPEQIDAIERAEREINKNREALAALNDELQEARGDGDQSAIRALETEIKLRETNISMRQAAIDDLENAVGEASSRFGGLNEEFMTMDQLLDSIFGTAASETEELTDKEQSLRQELGMLNRQLELMQGGMDASSASMQAQIEAAEGTARALLLAEQSINDLTDARDRQAEQEQNIADLMQRNIEAITGLDSATMQHQRTITDLRELYARGAIGFDEYQAAVVRAKEANAELTDETRVAIDELRRVFEGRFGEGLSDGLLDSLGVIEQIREAFSDIDGPFNDSIDRMLQGLQTFTAAGEAAAQDQFGMYTAGTAQMLSGVQQLATEGSSAYQKLGVAIQALQTITAVQAVLNQGAAGDPFTAFARMAAMAGAVASLGVAVNGAFGGGGSTYEGGDASTGGGSVLGSSEMSQSIANSVEITAEATEAIVGINTRMLSAMQNLQRGIQGVGTLIAREGGVGPNLNLAGGMFEGGEADILNNLLPVGSFGNVAQEVGRGIQDLGIPLVGEIVEGFGDIFDEALSGLGNALFGGDQELRGQGIQIAAASMAELINGALIQSFSIVRTSGGLFSGADYDTVIGELPAEIENQFQLIIGSIADSATAAAEALGISQSNIQRRLENIDFEQVRIDLQGATGEEISERISEVFSGMFDDVAAGIVPFIDEFQRIGEGAAETLTRIASNVQVAAAGLERVGQEVDAQAPTPNVLGGLSRARAQAQANVELTAQISTALVEAAGGFEEFASSTQSFVDDFRSESEQLDIATREATNALANLGIEMPETREGFVDLVDGFRITDEATARTYAELLKLAPALDEVFSASEKIAEEQTDLQIRLLQAQGKETAALNLERERELENVAESNRALLRQTFAAEDAREAMEEARRAQEQFSSAIRETTDSLAREIARMRGESVAALQIGNVLDAIGGAGSPLDLANASGGIQAALTQQLQEQIAAIEEQRQSTGNLNQAQIDSINTQIEGLNEQIRAAEQLRDIAQGIRGYLADLETSELGGGTPLERLAAAQSQFATATAAARAGDIDAAQGLQGQADTILNLARDIFASSGQFQDIRDQVIASLSQTEGQIDVTTPELQALESQISILEQQRDALREIRDNQPVQVDGITASVSEHTERLRQETANQLEDVQGLLGLLENATLLGADEQVGATQVLREALSTVIRGGDLSTVEGLDRVRSVISNALRGIVDGDEAISRIMEGGFSQLAGAFRDSIVQMGARVSGLGEEITRAAINNAGAVAEAIDQANATATAKAELRASAILSPLRALGFETAGMREQLVNQFTAQIREQQLTNQLTEVLGEETRGVQSLIDAAGDIISANVNATGREVVSELFGLSNLENQTREQIVAQLQGVEAETADAVLGILGLGGKTDGVRDAVSAQTGTMLARLRDIRGATQLTANLLQPLGFRLRDQNSLLAQSLDELRGIRNNMSGGEGFATGGIASGPSSGYSTTLHGTEAIMPTVRLPDGNFGVRSQGGGSDNRELVQELRESNRQLRDQNAHLAAILRVEQTGWKQSLAQGARQVENSDEAARSARVAS